VKEKRDAYVKRLNAAYQNGLDKDSVEHIHGHAKFTGPNDVVVGDMKIPAKRILIATGTKPMIPANTPGKEGRVETHCGGVDTPVGSSMIPANTPGKAGRVETHCGDVDTPVGSSM
jgi:pyruvate/2-oxoglutarate dehydrogenase complex dihydrolipoamide dehydrogenase (E3) component